MSAARFPGLRASRPKLPPRTQARAFVSRANGCNVGREGAGEARHEQAVQKRAVLGALAGAAAASLPGAAQADITEGLPGFKKDMRPVRARGKVDPSLYSDGPDGLRYYDVKVGEGPEVKAGDRIVVHFECKWRGITFVTSRQGPGVTGGEPYGFDVGATGTTRSLKGLDLGVRGMQPGGVRKLILPPNLGYGDKGVGEIPGGATLDMDVELLSIRLSAAGYRVKLVEG